MGERKDYAYGSSKYLRAADLLGKTSRAIIENVEDVQFDEKSLVDSIQVEVAAPLKRSESKSDPDFDDDLPENLVA